MQQASMEDQLDKETHTFSSQLSQFFGGDDFRIYSLAGDASARKYYRVLHGESSWVLMQWQPFEPETCPFLSVRNHFAKHSVEVPAVEHLWPDLGLVLLEDLGDLTLERKFWESQNQELILPFYQLAIEQLARIHYPASQTQTTCTAFHVAFDCDKFVWELNYTKKYLLEELMGHQINSALEQELAALFKDVGNRLASEPKFLCHRDYHSRNLMITLDELRVIDFQDARMGPVQYDLVSLLRDSYVDLEDSHANELMDYYLKLRKDYGAPDIDLEHFLNIYELQSVQRCFKACGSFASFHALRGDTRYLKHIPGTIRRVLKSLGFFPEYKLLSDLIIDSGITNFRPV